MSRDNPSATLAEKFFSLKEEERYLYQAYRETILLHKTCLEENNLTGQEEAVSKLSETIHRIEALEEEVSTIVSEISQTVHRDSFTIEDLITWQDSEAQKKYREDIKKLELEIRECKILTDANTGILEGALQNIKDEFQSIQTTRDLTRKYNSLGSHKPFSFYIDEKK